MVVSNVSPEVVGLVHVGQVRVRRVQRVLGDGDLLKIHALDQSYRVQTLVDPHRVQSPPAAGGKVIATCSEAPDDPRRRSITAGCRHRGKIPVQPVGESGVSVPGVIAVGVVGVRDRTVVAPQGTIHDLVTC